MALIGAYVFHFIENIIFLVRRYMERTVGHSISRFIKKMSPNCDCVGTTYKVTCSDTVFASLVMFA